VVVSAFRIVPNLFAIVSMTAFLDWKRRNLMCKEVQIQVQQIIDQLGVQFDSFEARFDRCEGLLYFMAAEVLGRGEDSDRSLNDDVNEAVHNCWLTASRSQQEFDSEGAFRRWLVRILITEAVAILHSVRIDQPTLVPAGALVN
jgi:hypothetical protein